MNPLGKFNTIAPVQRDVLLEAHDFITRLPTLRNGAITRIYGHWTVGHESMDFPDYNGSVEHDNGHFHLHIPHDPSDNGIGVNNNTPAAHTYRRNHGAFGIATDDMVFATTDDFGPEPLTLLALEYLCAGIAAVARKYNVDITGLSYGGPYSGEPNFLTHAEAADRPGHPQQYPSYGPASTFERWDLASFTPVPPGVTFDPKWATVCGNALRARAHIYKLHL